jgi:predicted phage terminase large subunit-like protein
LYCITHKLKEFIILISDTASQAEEFLSNIRGELEDNPRLREDFGNLVGDVWKADDIITNNQVRVLALGARKKIRGRRFRSKRPDLIIGDDIENDENTGNPIQRKKNENWFFKAVSKAGDDSTDIIVIGTIIHYDSLLSNLLKNPLYQGRKFQAVQSYSPSPLWQEWEDIYLRMEEAEKEAIPNPAEKFFTDNKEAMLADTKVLWPAGQPYYHLMELRLTEGPASFDSEYQNNPINPDDCLFQEGWLTYFTPIISDYISIVGAVDPSMGKTTHSDYSAIIFLGKHKDGFVDVLVADIARRHPDQIIEDIISQSSALYQSYGETAPITSFGVESVQFQEYFKDKLKDESNKRGVYLPVEKTENQNSKKIVRIQSLQPLIKNGTLRFQKEHRLLLEQLKYYPLADHDDGPDALEMAVRKIRTPQLLSSRY